MLIAHVSPINSLFAPCDPGAAPGIFVTELLIRDTSVCPLNPGNSSFHDGRLGPIDGSARPLSGTGVGPAQVAFSPDGDHLLVTEKNSNRILGSGSISGYRVDFEGAIALLNDDGRTGDTGSGSAPIDVVITDSGRYLYNLNSGTHTIGAFRIQSDGSLTRLPFVGGLPAGSNGLAAR